jgi:hypothetical protein
MMPFIIVDFSIILLKPICPFIKQAITHHSPIPKLHISSAVNVSEDLIEPFTNLRCFQTYFFVKDN